MDVVTTPGPVPQNRWIPVTTVNEKKLNILNLGNEFDVEMSKRMIEAAVAYQKEQRGGGDWNAMMLMTAAAMIMRFAIETSLPKEVWGTTMKWVSEDMENILEAKSKFGKKEIVN